MSSGYCTKLGTKHCSIIRIVLCGATFTLLKKRCQCFVDAPMLRSHRRQRPLTDNKEKPQPHCSDRMTGGAKTSTSQCKLRKGHDGIRNYDAYKVDFSASILDTMCFFEHSFLSRIEILIRWTLHRKLCVDMK